MTVTSYILTHICIQLHIFKDLLWLNLIVEQRWCYLSAFWLLCNWRWKSKTKLVLFFCNGCFFSAVQWVCVETFHLPRTFIPLLNWSDLLTVNCGGALVLLVGTGTLVVTVWIWTRSKEKNKQLETLTYESDFFYGGWKPFVRLLPAESRPAPSSPGKDFWWDRRKRPRWTPRRSSFPARD